MDELIYIGDAIKAEQLEDGGVKLGGYLVRFGDPSTPDLTGDYFTASTDFGQAEKSVTWFNHRLPVRLKKHNVQVSYTEPLPQATLKRDDVGVFAEVVILARNDYEKTIAELGMAGKLAWSSGTAGHLVDRKSIKSGVYEITRWPLGLDASLTPTPAEFRQTNQVLPMKSLIPSDAPLSDKGEALSTTPIKQLSGDNMEEEIKAAVTQAVAAALAEREAKQQAEAQKAADLKAAEEAGYKKALEDLKDRKAPAINTKTVLGFSEEKDAVPAFKHWMATGQTNEGLIRPSSTFMKSGGEFDAEGKAAWNVTDGGTGGYLVPDPLYNQIIAKRENASWIRQLPVQTFQTQSDHLLIPRESTAHAAFTLTAEAANYTENEGTVSQKDLILYKYTNLTKVNEEFLMYNSTNWESWFVNAMGRAIAKTENSIYTSGSGSGAPEGITTTGASTVANTLATADVVLPSELAALIGYLGDGYNVPSECGFLMNNTTKWYLKGTGGSSYLPLAYIPTPQGGDFFGYKAVINDNLSAYTVNAAKIIYFGNWTYYAIVEKPGMMVQRNPYLYQLSGQIGIFTSIFRGGGTLQAEAIYHLLNAS